MKKTRHYWVVTITPSFRIKTKVTGIDAANLLVQKNRETLAKYNIKGSVFPRRIAKYPLEQTNEVN